MHLKAVFLTKNKVENSGKWIGIENARYVVSFCLFCPNIGKVGSGTLNVFQGDLRCFKVPKGAHM